MGPGPVVVAPAVVLHPAAQVVPPGLLVGVDALRDPGLLLRGEEEVDHLESGHGGHRAKDVVIRYAVVEVTR